MALGAAYVGAAAAPAPIVLTAARITAVLRAVARRRTGCRTLVLVMGFLSDGCRRRSGRRRREAGVHRATTPTGLRRNRRRRATTRGRRRPEPGLPGRPATP